QPVIHEVGLAPLVDQIASEVRSVEGGKKDHGVRTLIMDEFVEYATLELLRRMRHDVGVRFRLVPWGTEEFHLAQLLEDRWFLTKHPRSAIALGGDALGTLHALDRLVTAKDSPLHPLMERRLSGKIRRIASSYDGLLTPGMDHQTVE